MTRIIGPVRRLGQSGLRVSPQGLGCMSMSDSYGPANRAESLATIRSAVEHGVNFFDTADIYGSGGNEKLLAEALGADSEDVVIATKFGIVINSALPGGRGYCGRPEYVRQQCNASLRRLRRDYVDVLYLHRVDYSVPLEDTVGAMGQLVAAGKVREIGLSEASGANIRRAHSVHPVAVVQSEWSLWSRDVELDAVPVCRELGIAFVAYGPLGRGFLTGGIDTVEQLAGKDSRRKQPRFEPENFEHNRRIVDQLVGIAARKGCTPSQLALAWLHHQGPDVIPLPGTTKREHLEENLVASEIQLSAVELDEISSASAPDRVVGARSADPSFINR